MEIADRFRNTRTQPRIDRTTESPGAHGPGSLYHEQFTMRGCTPVRGSGR